MTRTTGSKCGSQGDLSKHWKSALINYLLLCCTSFIAGYQSDAYASQDIGKVIISASPETKKGELIACELAQKASNEEISLAIDSLFSFIRNNRNAYVRADLLRCLGEKLQPAGSTTAYRIALMHRPGDDDMQRYLWLKRAADGGNLDAFYLLANAGIRAKQHSMTIAREIVFTAAKRGHKDAQLALARYHAGYMRPPPGFDVTIDGYQAIYWYSQYLMLTPVVTYSCGDFPIHYQEACSSKGSDLAAIKVEIGRVFGNAVGGVPRDYKMARIWWDLAVADGSLTGGDEIYRAFTISNVIKLAPEEVEKYKRLHEEFEKLRIVE